MDDQTRSLISLLIADETEVIVAALATGPGSANELSAATGISLKTVERRLHDLERWGMAARSRQRPKRPGRPAAQWSLTSDAWLRFERMADAFALELHAEETARLRAVVDKRIRSQLDLAESAEEDQAG